MLSVRFGKTAAARRTLPLTAKVRCILSARHVSAGSPVRGYVFPAPTKSSHLEDSGLRKAHAKALRLSKVPAFMLYSFRHTFATRIATRIAERVDAWTLCKIMGWASLSVAMRYIHPDEKRVLAAFGQEQDSPPPQTSSNSSSNVLAEGLELSGVAPASA